MCHHGFCISEPLYVLFGAWSPWSSNKRQRESSKPIITLLSFALSYYLCLSLSLSLSLSPFSLRLLFSLTAAVLPTSSPSPSGRAKSVTAYFVDRHRSVSSFYHHLTSLNYVVLSSVAHPPFDAPVSFLSSTVCDECSNALCRCTRAPAFDVDWRLWSLSQDDQHGALFVVVPVNTLLTSCYSVLHLHGTSHCSYWTWPHH